MDGAGISILLMLVITFWLLGSINDKLRDIRDELRKANQRRSP